MTRIVALLLGSLLLGNAAPSKEVEIAELFAELLLQNNVEAASDLMVEKAGILEWSDGPASIESLAAYINGCPIYEYSLLDDGSVSIFLECEGEEGWENWNSVKLKFSGGRIYEVAFGPPPVGVRSLLTSRISNKDLK